MPFIEEIDDDDIDNKHFSIEDFDAHNPFSKDTPVEEGAPVQHVPTQKPDDAPRPAAGAPPVPHAFADDGNVDEGAARQFRASHQRELPEHMKEWKVLYPLYFDKGKTVRQGRRVPVEFAVDNPLAVTLADACRALGFEPALELTKTHPKDWANPGRVRIDLAGRSKRELYGQIAKQLKARPVDSVSAREQMYRQVAQFDSLRPRAVPRNMSMPKILPGVSPALSAQKMIDDSMKMDGNEMAKMMGMG